MGQIDKGKSLNKIYLGNIKAKRDYIDVRDVANALKQMIRFKLTKKFEIINISNQSNYSIKDILRILSVELKTIIKVIVDERRLRKFDRPHQTGSNKKLINLIKYKPKFNLEKSIKNIINR